MLKAMFLVFCIGIGCASETPTEGPGTFSTLLAHIPDTWQTREVVYIHDYARARELFDISLPGSDSDVPMKFYVDSFTTFHYVPGLDSGRAPWISGLQGQYDVQFDEYLAFSARNVDQTARTAELEVVRGQFDPDATRRALARCLEQCQPHVLNIHDGVGFYSWGSGGSRQRMSPPAFDQVGRGGHITVLNSYVYRTLSTQDMKDLISARSGSSLSLADDPDFALAAHELDRLGAYSGSIRGNVDSHSLRHFESDCISASETECAQLDKAGGILGEYDVLGVGIGRDVDGIFIVVTLVYESESSAADNEIVFRNILEHGEHLKSGQPWREYVRSAEVTLRDKAVVAKLRIAYPQLAYYLIYDPVSSELFNQLFIYR